MRPPASHRCHVYVNEVGVVVQMPPETLRVDPTFGAPVTTGRPIEASCDGAATGPMRLAVATAVPDESFAVTVNSTVLPTSAGVRRYVGSAAPEIAVHVSPMSSQRYHLYEYEIVPVAAHVPLEPVICDPARAVPTTLGSALRSGPDVAGSARMSADTAAATMSGEDAPRVG